MRFIDDVIYKVGRETVVKIGDRVEAFCGYRYNVIFW